jgi:tagaturonate epimerase
VSATFPFGLKDIRTRASGGLYTESVVTENEVALWLESQGSKKSLGVVARRDNPLLEDFRGEGEPFRDGYVLKRCPTDHDNARALRRAVPWLEPAPLGLGTSAGFGDRLGLATPGHVRALQRALAKSPGAEISPIFAQQSIREMARTQRTPEEVMSDATWGAFQAGWRSPVGADADHLKTPEDIDACVDAGFTFFTIDPGEFVDDGTDAYGRAEIKARLELLPWDTLESSQADVASRYARDNFQLETRELEPGEEAVFRAAVKYGRAVAHVVEMSRYLETKGIPYELEVSVDETETPTNHVEHMYVARELERLGVRWISLAPRYVGRFEKGIDYIGDLEALRVDLDGHAEIARVLGPYKLSLHSGSDKFSVYPLIQELTRGMVHLKTAGTSYLEALRVVSRVEPKLFRDLAGFAFEHYPKDRASYHVSAESARIPDLASLADGQLPRLLDHTDVRQVLHVTFGSVLERFQSRIVAVLISHDEDYFEALENHFYGHLEPFVRGEG